MRGALRRSRFFGDTSSPGTPGWQIGTGGKPLVHHISSPWLSAVSPDALKAMSRKVRGGGIHKRSNTDLRT